MLQLPERALSLGGEHLRDGHARPAGDFPVQVHEGFPGPLRQELAHGGLAAAGHPHQHEVGHLPPKPGGDGLRLPVGDGLIKKQLLRPLGLVDQHGKAPGMAEAQRLRL